ncbi:uncharacterized protein NECHADRAFT_91966 [Fusarium vanettenii 77-13-4]|uniref:Uncharacterized protein n=1 Tax=Fusarium vanettenii (strain ATCC MYA-4622 / CBS 123669 / FGSC 9596 / NRRL 45880 / 77-13-4) TaxID=660122 RepID=C7YMF2_FUSV7|nr:uncharacterized protein NECHADRAFT_91966 [Fusarium vanettenii 77-13-4]EEU47441.1 hypothetical protein NECHADRAFT_91966 [Fusarium vanettenii 77-13-4]
MDSASSPGSIDSTSTAPTSASKVTYTTAGTPYNPSTAQPLQPPARRGRSLKWSAGLHTAGLSLFPKSALASLPVKFVNHSSSSQEHSPMQTTLDRAISPIHDTEHTCANMSAQVPRLVASATPSPLASLFSEVVHDALSDAEASDDNETEYELGMDPLLNMTVKSLQNLASYPNPNQKRAQKALSRGTKAAMEGYKAVTRSEEPSTPLSRRPGPQEPLQIHVDSPSMLRHAQAETIGYSRPQDDGFWNPPDKSCAIQPDTVKPFDTAVGGRISDKFGSATLASGPGAPRPLSAGPPGQRQYRPSTFKSTFKALKPQASSQDLDQEDDDDVLMITRQTLQQAGIDEKRHELKSPLFKQTASLSTAPISVTPQKTIDKPACPFETLLTQQLPYPTCWNPTPATSAGRYAPNNDVWAANKLQKRREMVERAWYAGANFMSATTEELAWDVQFPKPKCKFGAVGDGRPIKKGGEQRSMETEKIEHLSVAELAGPLLNMAFVKVQQFQEDELQKKYAQEFSAF